MEKYLKFSIKRGNKESKISVVNNIIPKSTHGGFQTKLYTLYKSIKSNLTKEHKCKIYFYKGNTKRLDRSPYIKLELFNHEGHSWTIYLSYVYIDEGLFIRARFGFKNRSILFRNNLILKYDLLSILREFIDYTLSEWSSRTMERFNDDVYFNDNTNLYEKLFIKNKIFIFKYEFEIGHLYPEHTLPGNAFNNSIKGTHV